MTSQQAADQPGHQRLHLRVVAHSEVGLVRQMNQDSGYASPHLLVVADGMGGAAAGDLASAVAIDVIKGLDTPDLLTGPATDGSDAQPDEAPDDGGTEDTVVVATGSGPVEQGAAGRNPLLGRFAAAVAEANSRIADLVAADYSLEGMGTTVTGALFDGQRLALVHIGDSRAYLLRGGHLERLTHDHSWVQSLVDEGKISVEEAAYHPHRSLLLKVLNGQPANDPDQTSVELRAGDRLLFCSDGLCGLVDDDEIARLAAATDLEDATADLVDAALAAGGIDNITVILAEAEHGLDPVVPVRAAADQVADDDDDTAVRAALSADTADGDLTRPASAGSTAVRNAGAGAVLATGGTLLGAAVDRDIPVVPRRTASSVSGLGADEGDEESDTDDDHDEGPPASPSASAAASAGHHDDEARYAPGPPAKRRVIRTLLVGLVVLLVAGAGLGAGYAWTRTQYFVGASDAQVAIFQGLPDGIPGLPLSQVYEVQQLPVASLPPYYQAQVTAGIEVASLDAARATVEQLKGAALRCPQPPASPAPPASPSPGTTSPTPDQTPAVSPQTTAPVPTTTAAATLTPAPTTPTTPLPSEGC